MKIRMPKLAAALAALFALTAAAPGYAATLTEIPDGLIVSELPAIEELPERQPDCLPVLEEAAQNAQAAPGSCQDTACAPVDYTGGAYAASAASDGSAPENDPGNGWSDPDDGVPNVPVVHYDPAARGNPSLVLNKAQEFVGWSYSQARRMQIGWADCSSFVWRVFRSYGVTFGSPSYAPTAAGIGQWLDQKGLTFRFGSAQELEPGDILFWGGRNNGRYKGIYHTGIYAGNGLVYEASSKCGVAVRTLWGVGEMPFAARLVTPEGLVFAGSVNIAELVRQARILTGRIQAREADPEDRIRMLWEGLGACAAGSAELTP